MMRFNGWYGSRGCPFWGSNGFGIWNFLLMIGVGIIIVTLIYLVRKKKAGNDDQNLNILKELYAKGEISEEEYLKRKNVIK